MDLGIQLPRILVPVEERHRRQFQRVRTLDVGHPMGFHVGAEENMDDSVHAGRGHAARAEVVDNRAEPRGLARKAGNGLNVGVPLSRQVENRITFAARIGIVQGKPDSE